MGEEEKIPHQNLVIKKSGIHGYGLFARRAFKKGEYIETIRGSRVHYKTAYRGQSNRYENWIGIGKDTWIDPVDEFRYINHSTKPNTGIAGTRTLKAYALEDISKGDEITIDYSTTEADEDFFFDNQEPKHKKYRAAVGPIQSLPKEVFENYLPFIPTYFKKVYEREVLSKDGKKKTR